MNDITEEELYADQTRFPTKSEALNYIYVHTGKIIPYVPICEGHDAPAEFIIHILYGEGGVIAIACRSGSKTTQVGIGVGMLGYHLGAQSTVLGGSEQQSKAAYDEFTSFLYHGFISSVRGNILAEETRFENGGSVKLLTQSTRSVRSPHVPIVVLDELDEFKSKILKPAKFIAQSSENVARMLIESSTRHIPMGLMAQEWEQHKGKKLIWCILEVMAPCTGDYKCSTCNLNASCPGKKKMGPKNKGQSGYYSIDDARGLRDDVHDQESWDAEALCLEPRTEGREYKLDESQHLADLPFDNHYAVDRVFDYGAGSDPMVCQWWQLIKYKGRLQARKIDETRWIGMADRIVVNEMLAYEKEMGYNNWIGMTLIPGDGKSLSNEMETRGIIVTLPDQEVFVGNATVRNLLTPDKHGIVGLVMDRDTTVNAYGSDGEVIKGCYSTWMEMKGYQRIGGRIVKKNDHGPDCLRYFCHSTPELVVGGGAPLAVLPKDADVDP